jgi:large subunit ribosomal protein L15
VNTHEVNAAVAGKPVRHRVGRGPASGWGTTSGRGMNGARCRSGYKRQMHREGGQMPIVRRIPKRGFNNKNFGNVWAFVNLHDLNSFADGAVVTPEECLRSGLIPKIRSGLKVLGVGTLEKKLTIKAHRVSETAKAAIEAKGGTIQLLEIPGENARKDWKEKRGKGKRSVRREEAKARVEKKAPKAANKGKKR